MGRNPYIAWALVAALLPVCFSLGSLCTNHGGNLTHAIRVGSVIYNREGVSQLLKGSRPVIWSQYGFDGQFFLSLAHDPLLRNSATARAMDAPHFRARRILYPLLARLVETKATSVPFGMLMTQYLSLFCLSLAGALYLRDRGKHPLCVFCLTISFSLAHTLETFTSEVVATLFVLLALLAHVKKQWGLQWCFCALAILTKEVTAIVVLAISLTDLVNGKWKRAALLLTAAIPLIIWIVYVSHQFPGEPSLLSGSKNLGLPLKGLLLTSFADLTRMSSGKDLFVLVLLVTMRLWFLLAAIYSLGIGLQQKTANGFFAASAGILALLLTSGGSTFAYDVARNFARQLFLLPPALFLLYTDEESRPLRLLIYSFLLLSVANHYLILCGRISF